jgi:putative peptide zinc metalloprotease protein
VGPDNFDLVLPDGRRVPLEGSVTIGRAPGNGLALLDPSVSRQHARIVLGADGPLVEAAAPSSGTWVDGMPVHGSAPVSDGARIRLGNVQLVLERRRAASEAGRTSFVPVGASAAMPADTTAPRLRSGYALKRLDASEGTRRWVLKDLRSGGFARLSDDDARLVALLDGRRTFPELALAAQQTGGPEAAVRLASLLADLGEKGLIAGAAVVAREPPQAPGWRRFLTPRSWTSDKAGALFGRLYRAGGWRAFTPAVLATLAGVASIGVLAFAYLVAGRYGTPFVVANKVGLGGLVFLVGRLGIAAVHEAAHALTMEKFGRRVGTAGIKLVLIFPYAFVDTSDAWFESRRHRIAVSAAGPVSDFTLGGTFALFALVLPAGALRDIFFQLAFAAYVGAVFNLNPFVQRDGYHILVDVLREPQLRARANEQLRRKLAREDPGSDSPVLARYSAFRVGWLALAAMFSVAMSLHYEGRFAALVPPLVAWVAMGVLWVAFFVPVVLALRPILMARARGRRV